ncbi:LuxR C-terminal-related transcriptional regulator [Microbispora sp. NPDC088329]|uniref:LuxR C-terminal-related transcriptional regulator n=1 Tax=Microbispora sp. NPDC088329 TaxID=3154869 RepID=UPI003438B3F8
MGSEPLVILVENLGLVARSLDDMVRPRLLEYGFRVLDPVPGVEKVPPITTRGLAICDVDLRPGLSGADAVRRLGSQGWSVLLISGQASAAQVLDAIAAGAHGYIDKSSPDEARLIEAIATAADGRKHLSPVLAAMFYEDKQQRRLPHGQELSFSDQEVLRAFVRGEAGGRIAAARGLDADGLQRALTRIFAAAALRRRLHQLTDREIDILRAFGCSPGATAVNVAGRLNIEVNTVNSHLLRIRKKYLATHSVADAAVPPTQQVVAMLWARELGLCTETTHRRW